jgi:N6-adenosine-specific RNA methylase IME4
MTRANQDYGALIEGVHLAGYSLERAFRKLEWLLDENRWKTIGEGFEDVNAFLDTIQLDSFKIIANERKKIAERIKELQPGSSNRSIAKVLGVHHDTVNRDLGGNPPLSGKIDSPNKGVEHSSGGNPPTSQLSGTEAAKAVERTETKDERSQTKKNSRELREVELGEKQAELPAKKYGVIYADPEWRFEVYSRDTGMDRAADNHYPTSGTDAICARPVADIAADDCALFLWATVPMLPDALRVMAAWGFDYKSHCIWAKDRIGTGYWFRNQHELLLVGTRGKIPAPAMGTQVASLFDAPVGKHSAKPVHFYELIESYFPTLPKIELNARAARLGWDAWGYEAPTSEAAE